MDDFTHRYGVYQSDSTNKMTVSQGLKVGDLSEL